MYELALDLNMGYIDEKGEIVREYSAEAEGEVYRSVEAFEKKEGICYINVFDVEFTYKDFLEEDCGNEEIARWCFEMMICTWNFPDSYFEDGVQEGYFTQCDKCCYIYDHNEIKECPKCKTPYKG
ncbi:hypothetical protein [Clostridium magnum]|uniref:Uncharacterized protein n=1 Tax=Clostridium magnum DSM 2767 TaxID=1121326 RepID=A0A162QT37_9CLOT|nr:hypothetical protein [Clostridium magnum]KZL88925.1 hypothetical protein CLMAG_58290 [Clostridium magnum DSM 2767]SHI53731.1 hypothetical protein SAMN02745944_04476 [Clostridium magnum DSM 2767]